jgi:endogenous inhibitor of DNA gyrase (YacG/DUF329 family)
VPKTTRPLSPTELICSDPACRAVFKASPKQRARSAEGHRVYHSRGCQVNDNWVTLPCAWCEKQVRRTRSEVPESGRVFCGSDCRDAAPSRERSGTWAPCDHCSKPVYRIATWDKDYRFCGHKCRGAWLKGREVVERPQKVCEREGCDEVMHLTPDEVSHGKRFHSPRCAYLVRQAPIGYRYVDRKSGYAWVHVDDGQGDGGTMRVQEHRWVMEQHIGRPLRTAETVHHMTGGFQGRSNNDLSNLQLWSGRHPKGHRIEDIVLYCREMLSVYGAEDEQVRYADLARAVLEDAEAQPVEELPVPGKVEQ